MYIIILTLTLLLIFSLLFIFERRYKESMVSNNDSTTDFYSNYKGPSSNTEVWNNNIIQKFETFIKNYNPLYRFNIDVLQKNTTEDEVKYFLKNGVWPWSQNTKNLFMEEVSKSSIINIDPLNSLNKSMEVYPQSAILNKLYWNSPEGNFIVNGGILPNYGKIPNVENTIICHRDNKSGNFFMKKNIYKTPNSGIDEYVSNEDIPVIYNKFQFLDEPCNPCSRLNDKSNFSCRFKIV